MTEAAVAVADGAYDGFEGRLFPEVLLPSTTGGELDVVDPAADWTVVYLYPRTGVPGEELPAGWLKIPGAFGCTAQSCGFRDVADSFAELKASVRGVSTQNPSEQRDFAAAKEITYPLLSDSELRLVEALGLPTFEGAGERRIKRATFLVAADRTISRVLYPVVDPGANAAEALAALRELTGVSA
ncbi:MAG: hypothetical protein NVSMB13_14170 [Mycobacteriales bacterium]